MAVFGAKNPHTQFTVAGGVTCYDALTPKRIKEFRDIYAKSRAFIEEVYIPDLLLVASYYKDWAGIGGTSNFMAFGEFPAVGGERDLNSRWYKPGVIYDRKVGSVQPFDPNKINEQVKHSWYEGQAREPYNGETNPHFTFMGDKAKYSWNKAPRYDNHAVETGPLAQMLVAYGHNHKTIKPTIDAVLGKLNVGPEALFSTLGRTAARGIQTLVIAQQMENWLNEYENNIGKDKQIVEDYAVPVTGRGVGFVDAPRGGLSHWMTIKDSKIDNFQLVVPTTWNLGPRDDKDVPSAAEAALVGTPVADPKRPVEILRTIHSFDPCIACSVHVIDGETNEVNEFKVL
jgi:[NiFe] hydrogenase large subunit